MERTDTPRIDAHIDIPWVIHKHGWFDLCRDNKGEISQFDFVRMKRGGLTSAFFALYLSDYKQDALDRQTIDTFINTQIRSIQNQVSCLIATKEWDIQRAVDMGRTPVFLGLEGGRLIHESKERLIELRDMGVRYLTLTHNRNTSWADSATDTPLHKGLSKAGIGFVKLANELGILTDVSHTSHDSAVSAIEHSTLPVIASHSGCFVVKPHPRNLNNSTIRGIADTKGVIHIPLVHKFTGPTISHVIDHIRHVVDLVGIDYVGIGSDLDGALLIEGFSDVAQWGLIEEALDKRNFSSGEIDKILGGNTMRLIKGFK